MIVSTAARLPLASTVARAPAGQNPPVSWRCVQAVSLLNPDVWWPASSTAPSVSTINGTARLPRAGSVALSAQGIHEAAIPTTVFADAPAQCERNQDYRWGRALSRGGAGTCRSDGELAGRCDLDA